MFYLWAWLRRVRAAEGFVIDLGVLSAFVGHDTFDLCSLSQPHPLPLAAVAAGRLVVAIVRQSSWRAIAGGAMLTLGIHLAGVEFPHAGGEVFEFARWHAPLAALLAATAGLNDELARELRSVAWRAAPCLALVAALVYPWSMRSSTRSS